MAFNPNKDKLKQSLNEKLSQPMIPPKKRKPGRPKGRTKFPLQVSLSNNQREKLERMAASAGYQKKIVLYNGLNKCVRRRRL